MADMHATSQGFAIIRILVVDDFGPWRHKVCCLLGTHALLQVVGEASHGPAAVQQAKDLQPDLILLDIGLPELSGIDAANQIRQFAPDAKILFLTQNRDIAIVRAALNTGATGYIVKSSAGSELLAAVEAVMRGDRFVSGELRGWET